jgi:hypothetical protein
MLNSHRLRRIVGAALMAAAAAFPITAVSAPTVDFSDLWFLPAESGWGANVIQQDDILFVTLFVYGPNGQPTWYVASSTVRSGATSTFSGPLFRASGPYFGAGSWPANSVLVTQVGTLTFTASSSNAATLTYSVEGVTVTKSIIRQTWDRENIAGNYLGATSGTWSGCGAGRDGYQETVSTFLVSQDGAVVQIREDSGGVTCNYNGTYSQAGRLGAIQGGGLCGDGVNQTLAASEVQMTPVSLAMRLNVSQASGCRFTGRMAAVRRGPP